MPYKRPRSPFYYIRRRSLPGYGDSGRLSSGVTQKAIALRMEQLLVDIAQRALLDPTWRGLLDAVCKDKTVGPAELLLAKNQGRLEALRRSLSDPLLSQAVETFLAAKEPPREVRIGLEHLLSYAPRGARLSYLDGSTITALCRQAERDGRKRNSVRRYILRAISHLLRHALGNAERERIFADVDFPAEDDTREIHLRPEDIARLLGVCQDLQAQMGDPYRELGVVIQTALLTSADRSVLLSGPAHHGREARGLLAGDLRIYQDETGRFSGDVYLEDTKSAGRSRTVPLTDLLCRELLHLARGKAPEDPVFSISYMGLDYVWKRVRKEAGLPKLRFKDLRAQVSQYGEEAGVPLTVLSRTMGHSREKMTQRYQQRRALMTPEQMETIEAAMFAAGQEAGPGPAPLRKVGGP